MEGEGREVWSEGEKGRVTDGGRETPKRGCDDGGKVRLPPPPTACLLLSVDGPTSTDLLIHQLCLVLLLHPIQVQGH